jgi:hypothetical protein
MLDDAPEPVSYGLWREAQRAWVTIWNHERQLAAALNAP